MKKLIVLSLFLLSACANNTAPVIPNWPIVPEDLQQPAPELTPLTADQHSLSDLLQNANDNYTQYYLIKEKYEGWQNWYNTQQKIWKGLQ